MNIAVSKEEAPTVTGGRCKTCDYVFAPFQTFGCERCGSHGKALEPYSLNAVGRLQAWATVFAHRFPQPATPFMVLQIELESGPIIRALASDTDDRGLFSGIKVVGRRAPSLEDTSVEPIRFGLAPELAESP